MQELYERWLSCGENWRKSSWAVSLSGSKKEQKRGCRRWMTAQQIKSKYNETGEGDEIAAEIVQLKLTMPGQSKPHPDLPARQVPWLKPPS